MGLVEGILQEYDRRSSKITLRFVNGIRQPDAASTIIAQYRLPERITDIVIFESANQVRTIKFSELSVLEGVGDFMKSREVRRSGFKGEQVFTSTIASFLDLTPPRVYFLTGPREHKLDDDESNLGYRRFGQLMAEKNLQTSVIELSGVGNDIPADCELLVIAGPLTLPFPDELEKIERYLDKGGRMLLLTHPLQLQRGEATGFEQLLLKWGIFINRAVVRDAIEHHLDSDVISHTFSSHPITAPLLHAEAALYFPSPRLVARIPEANRPPNVPQAENIVMTSTNGFIWSDFRQGTYHPTPELKRVRMEFPIAVAVEKGALPGVDANRGATRIVVIGDSSAFANNAIYQVMNRDLASLTLAWLVNRSQILAIGPRPLHEYRLNLTATEIGWLRRALLGVVPGSVLLLGFTVWFRRRT